MKSFFKKIFARKSDRLARRFSPFTVILLVFLIVYAVSLVAPLLWAFLTASKLNDDFRSNILGLPDPFAWNYTYVFERFYIVLTKPGIGTYRVTVLRMFLNTILYALGCTLTNTITLCATAYCCAKFKRKLSNILYTTVLVTMILPVVGSMPAEVQMAKTLGIYDHIWGLWIMKANFTGMYFLVFHAGFRGIPTTYSEAAKIDGANNFYIFVKIMLPLIKTLFFTVCLVSFISFWNDYQVPLLYMPSYPTLARGVYEMASTSDNELATIPMRMASTMLVFLPIFAVFLVFHKRLMGELTLGGIKG